METAIIANSILLGYTHIYTPLKRKNKLNTTIGAIIGSLTPYLGWVAAGGSVLDLNPLLMTTFLFGWQFAHFYGILWIYKKDYNNAGFVMVKNHKEASFHLKLSLVGKIASSMIFFAQMKSNPFFIYNFIIGYSLWKHSYQPTMIFDKEDSVKNARNLKLNSYKYFGIFFGIILIEIIYLFLSKEKLKKNKEKKLKNEFS